MPSPTVSTHAIPHSASEPPIPRPPSSQYPSQLAVDGLPSPPSASQHDREIFTSLRPHGSRNQDMAAYTSAASARTRTTDSKGNMKETRPDPQNQAQPMPLVKSIPEAATSALANTLTAPARTLVSIRDKLISPSTTQKSKTDIPESLGKADSQASRSTQPDVISSNFAQFMHRGPGTESDRDAAQHDAQDEDQLDDDLRQDDATDEEEDADDNDPEFIKERIRQQRKRLEDFDEAQTVGLLRTQEEAGIEPAQSPSRISRLVGLPLFANSTKHKSESGVEGEDSHGYEHERRGRQKDKDARPRRAASEKGGLRTPRARSHDRVQRRQSSSGPRRAASQPGHGLISFHDRGTGTWTSKLRTKIPIKEFPLQGSGRESEFNQERPLWARQPWKYAYFTWFGLSVGLIYLPWWSLTSMVPSQRGRPDWSWKKATMVKLFRHGTQLTFRTRTSLGRDLQKEVPHSKTVRCKFSWVDPVADDDIKGELKRAMKIQKIHAARTCGFWYGESVGRKSIEGVGKPAERGEKVLYHLHGGAYWIGTAHESDVTAAVNTECLRYMDEIYRSRDDTLGCSSLRMASLPPLASGKLLRSFSLDYRLCVPGRPRSGSYPAALLDALSGYLYLVRTLGFEPDNIIIAGDSAGGNLALALCRYLRDTQVEAMPGSMMLLSPWADISRSHAGPTSAPNLESTVYKNMKSDIISPRLAFRNTAVSAFLGDLPARETYRNVYMSPVSLQLPVEAGGQAPDWGFHGFPKRVYISTGSAEISYDQHLTLAHRMAAGTVRGKPVYVGDKLSEGKNTRELAERRDYPRPKHLLDHNQDQMAPSPVHERMERKASYGILDQDGEPTPTDKQAKKMVPEDRVVVFDEVKDAIHDYLLFKWFEPERSQTWRRIAKWIDEA
ncbi:alpha/beta-hydrolase [Testicularia cyperi]|uniref:Alpha/beta-hydrolase n=1 Tax=Testicularia cyperi TaxID=1882483 RepID=A0A317XRT8_9BASI|nr:alpha/beta-hydrolase [Testicularia cyperi]